MAFSITVQHDYGTAHITVVAASEAAAIAKVMSAEGCPACAITHIEEKH